MIGYLQGELLAHDQLGHADQVIVLVSGTGYQLTVPVGVVTCALGENLAVWVHSITREDGTRLYGFAERETIKGFSQLLDISGVGARVGIALLSAHGWQGLAQLISTGNIAALTQADGVGRKIAQRIVNEMSGKLPDLSLSPAGDSGLSTASATDGASHHLAAQAVSALCNLGYSSAMAQRAVQTAVQVAQGERPDASLEDIITAALQRLSQA